MNAWRLVRPRYADNPLSGIGSARWGSRWNSVGVAVACVSTSRPLALLEMLVHLRSDRFPDGGIFIPIEIPDDLISGIPDLPKGWNHFPYRQASLRVGDRWIAEGSSLAMFVPSAILPAERNILINPAHGHFRRINVGKAKPHAFDRRLFRLI